MGEVGRGGSTAMVGAKVLELLPDVMQPDIMHRIARLGPITPEAVEMLNALLAVRPSTRQQPAGFVLGGTREAAKIMSSERKATGERAMPKLANTDRETDKTTPETTFMVENMPHDRKRVM